MMNIEMAIKGGRQTALMHRQGGAWVVTTYHAWDFRVGHESLPMAYGQACQMVRAHRIQWALIAATRQSTKPGAEAPYAEIAWAASREPGSWEDIVRALADKLEGA